MKIESQDKRIDELLKSYIFVIPRFQRAYSWEPDHINDFWTDIINNISSSYFIGSMVVYKIGRSSVAVVDGQQRITTILILLCAIREKFKELNRSDLAEGLQTYIEQKDRSNKNVYVLQTETSFPYLQEEVLKNGSVEIRSNVGREEEAIARAFGIFIENIDQKIKRILSNKFKDEKHNIEEATDWLCQIRDTVFDLNVIIVELDNEDDAYLIFETLNTRGKDLALSDLVRNHFTKFLKPTNGVDHSKLKWSKALDILSSAPVSLDPDTFIVHSWQSRYDFITKAKTFSKLKGVITKSNAADHIDLFVEDAEHWRSIFDTDYKWGKNEKEVAKSLNALRIFKVIQPTPGVLSLIRAYRNGIIKYRTLRDVISSIERFHFSFNAVTSSRSSGGISGMYSSFGRQIFDSKNSDRAGIAISEFVRKLKDREVDKSEFDLGFRNIAYTNNHSSQKNLVQYILKKIAIHESQPFIGESDELTIEHLLPQSSIKRPEDETLVGQLGNLILVDAKTNVLLANKSFIEKRNILTEKGYKLSPLFIKNKSLDADLIDKNTARLSIMARKEIWKI